MLCSRPPQAGHLKPSGHRDATITARHCSSLPYCRSNAGSLSPFWNCTALRAISIPPPKALVCSWFVPYPGRLSKVRNQVYFWIDPTGSFGKHDPSPARWPASNGDRAGVDRDRGMRHDKEQRIRLRAYHIWERGGRGEERAEDHWRQAEIEVERELAQPSGQGFASQ